MDRRHGCARAYASGVAVVQSYVERLPPAALSDVVASTWVQAVDGAPLVHRDLPSGTVELRCRVGGLPELVGPLTRARVEILEPGTTVVGVRLRPGAAAGVLSWPLSEIADEVVGVDQVWPAVARRLTDEVATASTGGVAADRLLALVGASRASTPGDPLVEVAVRRLRWRTGDVGTIARELHVSERQLRRRMLAAVGVAPKTLHRTLRFQRFLALAQYLMANGRAPAGTGLAGLAADSGYADQAHLTRECTRLTGLTPGAFLRQAEAACSCGHDHAASYGPLLRARAPR